MRAGVPVATPVEIVVQPRGFERVIVGVGPSARSREAVRQAVRFMDGHGDLELVAAYEVVYPAAVTATKIAAYTAACAARYRREAAGALERARSVSGRDVVGRIVRGRPVVAHGGKSVDGEAVEALTALTAAADADLLVGGSRGLHGVKALGSVSERLAHRARCSPPIVREPPWTAKTGAVRVHGRGAR